MFLSGVPQGSVLGPLLFLIYIDILQHVDSTCRLYVDDSILYQKIESVHDVIMLQNDLCLLEQWEKKWKMSSSVDKCIILSVTQKGIPIQGKYFLHNTELKMTESAKYLGVEIDSSYL